MQQQSFSSTVSSSVSEALSHWLITEGPGLVPALKGGINIDVGTPFFSFPFPLSLHVFGYFLFCVLRSVTFEVVVFTEIDITDLLNYTFFGNRLSSNHTTKTPFCGGWGYKCTFNFSSTDGFTLQKNDLQNFLAHLLHGQGMVQDYHQFHFGH